MEEKAIDFYDRNFQKTKSKIDQISKSFCPAKWLQVSLHLTNGRTHSCYHPPTHSISIEEIQNRPSALHNTKIKFEERKLMLEGQRPSGCDYCWKIEDSNHISDRYYRSDEFWARDRIEEISSKEFDHDVIPSYVEVNFNQTCNFKCSYCSPHLSSEWEKEIKTFGPYAIGDYRHNDIDTLKKINLMPLDGSVKDNPYVTAFWKWWPDVYRDLRVFRMTGGEPLLDANTFKILEYVKENPNKNLELSVTSNLCPPRPEIFEKFLSSVRELDNATHQVECYVPDPHNGSPWQSWQHFVIGKKEKEYHQSDLPSIERSDIKQTFPEIGHALEDGSFTYLYDYQDYALKHFTLYVSVDSVGAHAEYIRNGLNYKTLSDNVFKFLSKTKNTSVSFINTFNLLSIPRFRDFLQNIIFLRYNNDVKSQSKQNNKKIFQRIWFDIPILENPEWLSVYNARDEDIEILENCLTWMETYCDETVYSDTLTGFKPYEVEKVKRNIQMIKDNRFDSVRQETNRQNFKKFFHEHDRRRGTDFIKTFPSLAEWYIKG
jgi:hypothetical protein